MVQEVGKAMQAREVYKQLNVCMSFRLFLARYSHAVINQIQNNGNFCFRFGIRLVDGLLFFHCFIK